MISSFNILNSSDKELIITHEPECFEFELLPNEEVTIVFNSSIDSLLLRHYLKGDNIAVDILEDKSPYRVVHKGVDVFRKYYDDESFDI